MSFIADLSNESDSKQKEALNYPQRGDSEGAQHPFQGILERRARWARECTLGS